MANGRERLHRMVDALPHEALSWMEGVLEQARARPRGHLEHVGIWVADLERARTFYERWFGAKAGARYSSARRPLQSYFLTLASGARLELMVSPGEPARLAHIAIALGSREEVDRLAAQMESEGISIVSEPRQTGDGYYEAVVADSEGNLIELSA